MSARRISAGPLQDRRGGYQPPGGFSWGASWAMRPPFSFWLRQKENAPRPVEEKKSLLVATLHVRAKLLYGGRREMVPACLRGSPDGRGGVRYRLERGFPRRGCVLGRGARTHLTRFSFRAFRFATRCPGGRGGLHQLPSTAKPAAAKREAPQCDDHPDDLRTIRHGTAVEGIAEGPSVPEGKAKSEQALVRRPPYARRATAPERARRLFLLHRARRVLFLALTKREWGAHPPWKRPPGGSQIPRPMGRTINQR